MNKNLIDNPVFNLIGYSDIALEDSHHDQQDSTNISNVSSIPISSEIKKLSNNNLIVISSSDINKDIISTDQASDVRYIRKSIITKLIDELQQLMAKEKLSRADVARRLNVSKANVTLMLSGEINMSIESILKFVKAINPSASLSLVIEY